MFSGLLNASEQINSLKKNGVHLHSLPNGNIKINGNNAMNSNDLEEIKSNKDNVYIILENDRLKNGVNMDSYIDTDGSFHSTPQQNQIIAIKNNFHHDYAYYIPFVIEFDKLEQSVIFIDKFRSYIQKLPVARRCFNINENNYYLSNSAEIMPAQENYYCSILQLDEKLHEVIYRPFKLGESLIRFGLIKTEKSVFSYFVFHHIISDGWSLGHLLSSILSENTPEPTSVNYGFLKNSKLITLNKVQQSFWVKYLNKSSFSSNLPLIHSEKPIFESEAIVKIIKIDKEKYHGLVDNAVQMGTSAYTVMAFILSMTIYYFGRNKDVHFISTYANRENIQLESTFDYIVESLIVRTTLDPNESLFSTIKKLAVNLQLVQSFADFPILEEYKKFNNLDSDGSNIDVMFTYQNFPYEITQFGGKLRQVTKRYCKSPILIEIFEFHEGLEINFEFSEDHITENHISQWLEYWNHSINILSQHNLKNIKIGNILNTGLEPCLRGSEAPLIQYYLHDAVMEMCLKHPSRIAIVDRNKSITYNELYSLVTHFSSYFQPKGYLVVMSKSHQLMVALLSILKAGGYFVCIDPADSDATLSAKLEISHGLKLLTEQRLTERITALTSSYIVYETLINQKSSFQVEYIQLPYERNQYMYGVFSSGTTGNPKLSLNYHDSFLNLVHYFNEQAPENKDAFILGSHAFDLVLKNLFQPLLCGSKIYLYDYYLFDVKKTLVDIYNSNVAILNIAYSLFETLLDDTEAKHYLSNIDTIIIGGEIWNLNKVKQTRMLPENCTMVNSYGPSETADVVLTGRCNAYANIDVPPLEQVLPGCQVSIVDENLRQLPTGCKGQLLIKGICVGAGYTQPVLNKNKFVIFEGLPAYLSGDIAEITERGIITIHGRIDDQVKINGIRIELSGLEIQIQQLLHPLKIALRIFNNPPIGTYIVGYYVSKDDTSQYLLQQAIQTRLAGKIPIEQLPRLWVKLDSFPLSVNGKLNRKALEEPPLPKWEMLSSTNTILNYVQNELGIPIQNQSDNLLMHGCDSIKMNRLKAKLEQIYGYTFSLRLMYDMPNLEAILNQVSHYSHHLSTAQEQSNKNELTGIERQFLFLDAHQNNHLYHITGHFKILKKITVETFRVALSKLLRQTEALRLKFDPATMTKSVITTDETQWPQDWCVIDQLDYEEFYIDQTIDLFMGFPIKFAIIVSNCGQYVDQFFVKIHHIVADEYSLLFICERLIRQLNNEELSFELINTVHKEVPANLSDWKHLKEINPIDFQRGEYTDTDLEYQLSNRYYRQLILLSQQLGMTEFSIMMAIFAKALHMVKGASTLSIGIPVSTRDTEEQWNAIGCFINTLPGYIHIDQQDTFYSLFQHAQHEISWLQQHKQTPLIAIKSLLHSNKDLFNVMLVRHEAELMRSLKTNSVFEAVNVFNNPPRLDLTLHYIADNNSLRLHYEFMSGIDPTEIKKIHLAIVKILNLLLERGYHCSLKEANLAPSIYFKQRQLPVFDIISRLLDNVEKSPNAIAIRYLSDGTQLSYKRLLWQIISIAKRLDEQFEQGVIAILNTNPISTIKLMLSTLYSGRSFMVMNSDDPEARMKQLQQKAQCVGCVSGEWLQSAIINYDKWDHHTNPPKITPDMLAYVIFTSGSTGEPKGASISYRALCYSTAMRYHQYQQQMERFLLLSPLTFDSAYAGLFGTLVAGGELLLPGESQRRSPHELVVAIKDFQPTQTLTTPSYYHVLIEQSMFTHSCESVILAGERLTQDLVDKHYLRFPKTYLYNEYGPTENTIWSSVYLCQPRATQQHTPIGKVLHGIKAIVMDEEKSVVPHGQKGQLYLGGEGLFDGYLNTTESLSFVWLDTFGVRERFYATGDLVTMSADGTIHFDSRLQDFIKIRGYRVSPAEIERCILQLDDVDDVKVTVIKGSLVAFISSLQLSVPLVMEYLNLQLPQYMIPHQLYITQPFPLNKNGKIDTSRLIREYVQVTNENTPPLEPEFNKLFSLNIGNIYLDPERSFFENGGNSIKLMQLSTELEKIYQIQIPITLLYQQTTLKSMQQLIKQLILSQTSEELTVTPVRTSRQTNKLTQRKSRGTTQ
ncbi:AMP-binding protein [Xenorhabdus griffiniae]|uniref:AMP-binding protein n=1 Tax=Xenorhabdus griffiniae TaxID=351672 RepID=UPI002358FAF6|nr:AMP-binding protein [Xenorhabdus griffiniae]MDC9605743.1 AMP-binding protein [Xenorhabdus griffiniae]